MSNFKYVKEFGYININNITYISDVFKRLDTWEFNVHFIDGTTYPVSYKSKEKCSEIIRGLLG